MQLSPAAKSRITPPLNNTSRLIEILLVNKLYKDGGASTECLISFCARNPRAFHEVVEESVRNVSTKSTISNMHLDNHV